MTTTMMMMMILMMLMMKVDFPFWLSDSFYRLFADQRS